MIVVTESARASRSTVRGREMIVGASSEPDPEVKPCDAGLQIERTSLAWIRTSLAFVVLNCLSLKIYEHDATLALAHTIHVALFLVVSEAWRCWGLTQTRRRFRQGGYCFPIARAIWLLANFWLFMLILAVGAFEKMLICEYDLLLVPIPR